MKRNIFIRMLCLLLCISMITPTVAAATGSFQPFQGPGYKTKWNPTWGVTTNEMAYVDQFFNHDGSYSDAGLALKHWLEMTPKSENKRKNSGYLLLEEEIEDQVTDKWRRFSIDLQEFLKMGIDMSGSLSNVGSLVTKVAEIGTEEMGFRYKFPKAGKSAQIYYNYFYQMYFDYLERLQFQIEEADKSVKALSSLIGDVTEYVVDETGKLEENATLLCAKSKQTASVVVVANNVGKDVRTLDVVGINETVRNGQTNVELIVKTDKGPEPMLLVDVLKENMRYRGLVMDLSDLEGMDLDAGYDLIFGEMGELSRNPRMRNYQLDHLSAGIIENLHNGVKQADGYDDLDNKELKQAAKKAEGWLKKKNFPKVEIPDECIQNAEKIGAAMDVVGAVSDGINYGKDVQNMTAQQICYLNAISGATQDYIDMIEGWRGRLLGSSVSNKEDIWDALTAVLWDFMDVQHKTVEEIAQKDASYLTKGSLASFIVSCGDAVNSVYENTSLGDDYGDAPMYDGDGTSIDYDTENVPSGQMGSGKEIGYTMLALTPQAASSATIMAINSALSYLVGFSDSCEAIYNLKWSLYNLLINNNDGATSLLEQYRKNRTHEKACEIICALHTMKSAKRIGENLMEEYYLHRFYDSEDIDTNSNMHMVLRNEMAHLEENGRLSAAGSVTSIIGVCEDHHSFEYDLFGHLNGVQVHTEILGLYRKNNSPKVRFKEIDLQYLPSEYKSLPSERPSTAISVPFYNYSSSPAIDIPISGTQTGTTINEKWLKGTPVTATNRQNMYKNEEFILYSENGLDVLLTKEEYIEYLKHEMAINELLRTADQNLDEEELENKGNFKDAIKTKTWIESIEMFDPSTDYSVHKIEYNIVP